MNDIYTAKIELKEGTLIETITTQFKVSDFLEFYSWICGDSILLQQIDNKFRILGSEKSVGLYPINNIMIKRESINKVIFLKNNNGFHLLSEIKELFNFKDKDKEDLYEKISENNSNDNFYYDKYIVT